LIYPRPTTQYVPADCPQPIFSHVRFCAAVGGISDVEGLRLALTNLGTLKGVIWPGGVVGATVGVILFVDRATRSSDFLAPSSATQHRAKDSGLKAPPTLLAGTDEVKSSKSCASFACVHASGAPCWRTRAHDEKLPYGRFWRSTEQRAQACPLSEAERKSFESSDHFR
jgi:hypothetical protein